MRLKKNLNSLSLKIFLGLLILASTNSCASISAQKHISPKRSNEFSASVFEPSISIKGAELNLRDRLGEITDFYLIENRYLVYDGISENYRCHLYDLETGKLTHFGKDGRGPGELLTVFSYDYRAKDR
ncbi:MAG: hypothetical protein AAF696_29710, partial [Bacteroidota bacterium]